jgi:aspartate ammonia-lyase
MSYSRRESDFLGDVSVPVDALYGSFTARALQNFNVSGITIHPDFTKMLAQVKKAAAVTNYELGVLDEGHLTAISEVLNEIIDGKHGEMFSLDVFQAGAGTPWNMNMNEVVANRANQILGNPLGSYSPVHPNDHVNLSQSSNDVIPNTIRITALKLLEDLFSSLNDLERSLQNKSEAFSTYRKSARTHARDAVPITLGHEFSAYQQMVINHTSKIMSASEYLRAIFLGGSAVGTGLNTPDGYSKKIIEKLRQITGLDLRQAPNYYEKTQFTSDFLQLMNALSSFCVDLVKMNNDLMLMSSGPKTGLSEISLPPVEPGSSIMPGKVNPSVLEMVNMVSYQVQGNRSAVEKATQAGMFDLNIYTPLIAHNLFISISWITKAVTALDDLCIKGITANPDVLSKYFMESNAIATLLNPVIGYEKASQLARKAVETESSVSELAVKDGHVTEAELQELLSKSLEGKKK